MRVASIVLTTCLLIQTTTLLFAEDRVSRLDEINKQIEELQRDVDSIKQDFDRAEGELKKIQYTVRVLSDREAKIKKDLGKVKASKAQTENIIRDIQEKIRNVEALSTRRTQALYMLRGEQAVVTVSHITQASQFDKAAVYLARIKAFDSQLVEDMKLLRVKRDTETGKLTQLQRQQTELLAQLELQKQELQAQVKSRQTALAEFNANKKKLDESLLGLKAQALRLETVVRSLTGGEEDEAPKGDRVLSAAKLIGFEGPGLKGKSSVASPFRGKIVQKFGKQKGSDGVSKKGIEFSGSGPVVAVAEGRVAYVGRMPQLGSVVIIDHGQRDYSLYGRLQGVNTKVGDSLSRGEALGEAGLPDEEGRTFYFEIRRSGTPVDPQLVFGEKLDKK